MFSGVRQGCPISPLLFAASVDVLLCMLARKIPNSTIRAFADDIGAVFESWEHDSIIAEELFSEFAIMSGLELNIKKTVCIPLWSSGQTDIAADLNNSDRAWKNICLSDKGTYLGFVEGPGRCGESFKKPTIKFQKRCKEWSKIDAGLQFNTIAYNSFAASTLAFVAQLEPPPQSVIDAEAKGIRGLVPGPGNWCSTQDCFFLKEAFGQTKSFRSIEFVGQGAKLRVFRNHSMFTKSIYRARRGASEYMGDPHRKLSGPNLSIPQMHHQLQYAIDSSAHGDTQLYYDRWKEWKSWYDSSHVKTLYKNMETLKSHGVLLDDIVMEAAGTPPPMTERPSRRSRDRFKGSLYKKI